MIRYVFFGYNYKKYNVFINLSNEDPQYCARSHEVSRFRRRGVCIYIYRGGGDLAQLKYGPRAEASSQLSPLTQCR